ncbi:sulfite exporter TauE/SafE family protein [Franzmannia qiaohouensis]|uniref:Probable membrane transporter protein n=1 Tax=Franzmannia qiaohouensis TaxID=1329370 RepID=A0ABU1HBL2_9GAMM|nr:sulfite exporter TauE/SafE family protein [Halomonas qiaohouensis]MDR5904847.1 sulfite exporter TauE/SafE family protein [Halomonas qiaohouensis]
MPEALFVTLDVAPLVWVGCGLTLLVGAFVQRVTGFGLAVVGAPILLLLEPRLVPVILVLFGFTVSLMMVGKYRHEVRVTFIGTALVGRVPGTVLGIWLLLAAPLALLENAIALIVLSAVAVSLLRISVPVNRVSLFVAGVLSGIFGTVSAIGGPPIAMLMHRLPPDSARGNLAAYFICSSLMTLLALVLAGQVRLWHLTLAVTLFPWLLVGNALANTCAHRFDRRALTWSSMALSTLAALGLLL